jgi:hypothetical protein
VSRKYDYHTSQKLAQKKAGEYEDPNLVKILDDSKKAKDKEKREAQRARLAKLIRSLFFILYYRAGYVNVLQLLMFAGYTIYI